MGKISSQPINFSILGERRYKKKVFEKTLKLENLRIYNYWHIFEMLLLKVLRTKCKCAYAEALKGSSFKVLTLLKSKELTF